MKFGIIKEGKVPPDRRVPLTPKQCKQLVEKFAELEVFVQKSETRSFSNKEYENEGIPVIDDLSHCDVLLGVKEVPVEQLIPGKTYLFFSHVIKEQPYNRGLLQAIIKRDIRLIDYECLRGEDGFRVIGFGRYAGIVGAYNGLLAYGKKFGIYDLKPAYDCFDRKEMESELAKIQLPNIKITLTGSGRVANGAIETLDKAGIKKIWPDAYLNHTFNEPVYTQLFPRHYRRAKDGRPWDLDDFFNHPDEYESLFSRFTRMTDLYISGHYWDSRAPHFFSKEDMKSPEFNIKVVADISCDINGPIGCTLRSSTIEEPLYGYHPETEKEVDFMQEGTITVMAVDNLPCELPRDASEGFGDDLIEKVIPNILQQNHSMIEAATISKDGKLTENYGYLQDFVKERIWC
ncbi:MAG: alanine dehydrogenase [Flavobacteriales bacterium]|nr:hypothetical protein [Bacteroidales bacterium AH-315-I05]PCJ86350.1 MAG: alanine dehydrogenase [Flavobacteriales bacterium]